MNKWKYNERKDLKEENSLKNVGNSYLWEDGGKYTWDSLVMVKWEQLMYP